MKKGKVVPNVPNSRRVNSAYDWDAHAKMSREAWPNAVLAETHVPVSHINAIRMYQTPPFRTDEGRVLVACRASKVDDDGIRYGDVYLTWVPNEKEEVVDEPTASSN